MGRIVFGRNFILTLPILALSACSVIEQPFLENGLVSDSAYGQYDQGCSAGTCAPGQSYSVAGPQNSHANPNQWSQNGGHGQAGYNQGAYGQGPTHVNPMGNGQYGQQYGGQHNQGYGAGHASGLRGARGQRGGNFYGTIGGVWYDTDIDSYGLEGRLGYDSGRILGAEIEGSVGLIDDNDTFGDVRVKSEFDYNVAAFALARLPLSERFSVHVRGGYDFRQLSVEATDDLGGTAEADLDLDGFAYGIGAEYALSPRSGLRLDFTSYDNNIGASESVSASFVRKF